MQDETFTAMMRRVVTMDDAEGKSFILVDDGPSNPDAPSMFEIWSDVATGELDPKIGDDLGPKDRVMMPGPGRVKARWIRLMPSEEDASSEAARAKVRAHFDAMGIGHKLVANSKYLGVHRTETLDVICVVQGEVVLILDSGETHLKPGNVVIQRGTLHAWKAIGGPVLLLAVVIDRPLKP